MKRYTVYVSDEDAELIDQYKDEFNLSLIARDAILQHVANISGEREEFDVAAEIQRSIAQELASSGDSAMWRDEIQQYRRHLTEGAIIAGAKLLERLFHEGVLTPSFVREIETRPRNQIPAELDRELLRELVAVLEIRDVPDDCKIAARKSFRDTLSRAIAGNR